MQDFQDASCLREAEAVVIGIGEAKHSKCSNCSNHFVILLEFFLRVEPASRSRNQLVMSAILADLCTTSAVCREAATSVPPIVWSHDECA